MWFLDRFPGAATAYVLPLALRLQGVLNMPVLHASLQELICRHESLRTHFPTVNGQPQQVIDEYGAWSLNLETADVSHELGHLSAAEQEKALNRWAAAMQSPFDLASEIGRASCRERVSSPV